MKTKKRVKRQSKRLFGGIIRARKKKDMALSVNQLEFEG
jgi:hypothetical protein